MTDSKYTHILAIVDRSGSMSSCQADMRGALDEFFNAQAAEDGTCLVDYVQFDNTYEHVFGDRPVAEAKAVLEPRGMTALLDAIGRGATDLGNKLRALPEARRPGRVVVAVVTDGGENASREWTRDKVAELVRRQEDKYNWLFTFLGANMDAVAVGTSFGFSPTHSMEYVTHNKDALYATATSLSNMTSNYRGSGIAAAASYSADDRNAAVGGATIGTYSADDDDSEDSE